MEEPPVLLKTDSMGLRTPDNADPVTIGSQLHNVQIRGPGNGSNGSLGVDMTGNSWDWAWFSRIHLQQFDDAIKGKTTGQMYFDDWQITDFNNQCEIEGRGFRFRGGVIVISDGAELYLPGQAKFSNTGIHCVGESKRVVGIRGNVIMRDVRLGKFGSDDSSRVAINFRSGRANLDGITLGEERSSGGWASAIKVNGGSDYKIEVGRDKTNSVIVVNLNAKDNGIEDTNVVDVPDPSAVSVNPANNPVRPRWKGVIGGGPFGVVDLSSTTGQFVGDEAIADGTSVANAGDKASWDTENSQ